MAFFFFCWFDGWRGGSVSYEMVGWCSGYHTRLTFLLSCIDACEGPREVPGSIPGLIISFVVIFFFFFFFFFFDGGVCGEVGGRLGTIFSECSHMNLSIR
jgi:hypothetical protein